MQIMSLLRHFGDEINFNRVANGEFTPETKAFMCGAAEAVGVLAPEVVT
jgi:hypothetical protein